MVTVVMTTYNPESGAPRYDYAARCLMWLKANLLASEHREFVLTDDGSPDCGALWSLGADRVVVGPHNGIGSSLNRALDGLQGPWMYTTDDWLLKEPLDLELPLWLLEEYDLVRLGPIHPNLRCTTKFTANHGWWLEVDPSHGGFAFATRPFLARQELVEQVGLFDEGLDAYETERLYAERCMWAHIRVAAVNLAGPWEHIGEYEVGDRPVEV